MKSDLPLTRDLVLIGGGHTHALVLRDWGMKPLPGARLTVINPAPTAAYSGMLPGFVAGHYSREQLGIDLYRLAGFAGARLIEGAATAIDLERGRIAVDGRPDVAFDVASVDVGITSAMPGLPGFEAHAIPAKPLGPFAAAWADYRDRPGPANIAVIGAGVAGAELSMAMAHALRARDPRITLVDSSRALTEMTPGGRRRILSRLRALGIDLMEHTRIDAVTADGLTLGDGGTIPADFVVGVAGATPWNWLAETGLQTHQGALVVDRRLRTTDPRVFAAGDCAHMSANPRPKAGVYAVRQAPVLAHNLRSALAGKPLKSYAPQRGYLKLVSLGDRSALAEKFGVALSGAALWRWKDHIDRRFMDRLNDLPPMAPPRAPGLRASGGEGLAPIMCAGCGSKVGKGSLQAALNRAPRHKTAGRDAPAGGGFDDAAILDIGGVRQVVSTDHLRGFVDDPYLMTRIAAHHALGDLWAMAAQPRAALVSLILPRLSPAMQERTLVEIMAAAREVMHDAGAEIVGGHTSMGPEVTIGFTVIGEAERPVTLGGARPGDALVLTKPIGSGTILAAAMQRKVGGPVLSACLSSMDGSQRTASRILADATAMTDVTGFGLAGHLSGLCAASGCGAEIDLAALPLMEGAEDLAAAGIRSSLWEENRLGAGEVTEATGARGDLLFDPQTAGGLLAALPDRDAGRILSALKEAGVPACRIGRMRDGPARIACV